MYLPPANFQQFTINDYDSVTVLVMTFFTVGFQPEGPLKIDESFRIGGKFRRWLLIRNSVMKNKIVVNNFHFTTHRRSAVNLMNF